MKLPVGVRKVGGSYTARVGGEIIESFCVKKHGDQGALIKALTARLEYLDRREKFKLDFQAFEVLSLVRKMLVEISFHGQQKADGYRCILGLVDEVLKGKK